MVELRPHPSYARHGLSVDARRLSALADRGHRALSDPIAITRDRIVFDFIRDFLYVIVPSHIGAHGQSAGAGGLSVPNPVGRRDRSIVATVVKLEM